MSVNPDNSIKARLDRIEDKLDRYLEKSAQQDVEIKWVKGYIKVSISAIIAIAGALASVLFGYIFKTGT